MPPIGSAALKAVMAIERSSDGPCDGSFALYPVCAAVVGLRQPASKARRLVGSKLPAVGCVRDTSMTCPRRI